MEITSETFVQRIAYSYIRFSSSAQSEGDSFRRQMERTLTFCTQNGLHLSETRYEDLGVSGYTGENFESGAISKFVEDVKRGRVRKGSVLLVENWDRFSRLEAFETYTKLVEILKMGVEVATLSDGKFYNAKNHGEFRTLITSLLDMERAHAESKRKSDLIQNALSKKRKQALAGAGILTTRCPAWLRVRADKKSFELIPERAEVVQRIIKLTQEGKGKREIARMLNAEKVPTWGSLKRSAKEWHESNILALTKSRALMGALQLDQKKQKDTVEVIPGYYPALIDEKTWQSIQPEKREFTGGPQSDVMNLFSGLLHDGYHPDYRMKVFMAAGKKKTYYYLQSDYRRVDPACTAFNKATKGKSKKAEKAKQAKPLSRHTLDYKEFEQHLLQHFEEFDFTEIMPKATPEESSRVELLKAEKRKTEKAVENLLDLVQKGNGGDSVLVMGRIRELEVTAKRVAKDLAKEELRCKKERLTMDGFDQEQARLEELLTASTREARLALRALFHRIISRIDVYTVGLFGGSGHVPEELKTTVYPDRVGMSCYCLTLVGSYKMWFWWDGTQVWLEPDTAMPPPVDKLEEN
jgi:DNA invertase Pin-like site-specific DNA recombinase